MNQELEVLKSVTQRLKTAGIPYMITGSIAAGFYAVPRMTRDIDIVIELDIQGADRLSGLLQNDFYIDRETVMEAVEQRGLFNILHNEYVIKVDLIVRKDHPYRELEFRRRREIKIEDARMWIVSPEDLVLSKLLWAKDSLSEQQMEDIKNLLAMVKDLDLGYIKEWVVKLALEGIYARVQ